MRGAIDNTNSPKILRAESYMAIEKIDVLVLTETHCPGIDTPPCKSSHLLAHTSLDDRRAGVAIVTPKSSGWSSDHSLTLVPGRATLTHLYHRKSTESVWMLGIYADISSAPNLKRFYQYLLVSLVSFIRSYPTLAKSFPSWPTDWPGCIAIGDWNMVEHADDRLPFKAPPAPLLKVVRDVLAVCRAQDAAGPNAFPRGFTWSQARRDFIIHSRLDRIYIPTDTWSANLPTSIPTNWSDHKLVWADCTVLAPRVKIAQSAPRLPNLRCFKNSPQFWKPVMEYYNDLVNEPITLERWTDFKTRVLLLGTRVRKQHGSAKTANWRAALRGDLIPEEDLHQAIHDALRPAAISKREPLPSRSCRWRTALPAHEIPLPYKIPNLPRKATRWGRATDPHPHPWVYSLPQHASIFDTTPRPSDPIGPWFPAFAPPPQIEVADFLDRRAAAKRVATLKKYRHMAEIRSSEWFKLSSNKEADERGSRASISVEGLRRSSTDRPSTALHEMLPIARSFFSELHTPEAPSLARSLAQSRLLSEVTASYKDLPAPTPLTGPFTLPEVTAVRRKMHSTAPGPDGIHNPFYKELADRIDEIRKTNPDLPSFWSTFMDLTDDIRSNGTNRCHFKDANLSLFFKKGDPTLVSNYRPISSMNTDCKMYTNLINNRLIPWAVSKLHLDQKGFMLGRLITEHTRLATEVFHLSNRAEADGYIVSLDQAKAYDRTDLSWLIRVLHAMGLCPDLISLIQDMVYECHTRVHINSAYSRPYTLSRGVRQGDPLSCLLYAFNIEPMGMRLRSAISGISVYNLPPAKLLMYADDMNLFLSTEDNLPLIRDTLSDTALAIGSKFNYEKTDILLVGSHDHRSLRATDPLLAPLLDCFTGAYILPIRSPLRILGIWVGSPDYANDRWTQIALHVRKIIRQWNNIGASMCNRALLAKALLQSRCYYLLDGNGIPNKMLRSLSNTIQRFVRGKFSLAPYSILAAPVSEGGLDCPSLIDRKLAYNAKFISDLITLPSNTLWKDWTRADLFLASSYTRGRTDSMPVYPLVQQSFTTLKLLEPRVRQAITSCMKLGYNIQCAFPSTATRRSMPALFHPALPRALSQYPDIIESCGIYSAADLLDTNIEARPLSRSNSDAAALYRSTQRAKRRREHLCRSLSLTQWDPTWSPAPHQVTDKNIKLWPLMANPLGCARILVPGPSLLTTKSRKGYSMPSLSRPRFPDTTHNLITVWTDGSAHDNRSELCTAGSAWYSDAGASEYVHIVDNIIPSNNIAEVVAVIMALRAWSSHNLHIITDSSFVLGLFQGRLLAMERDGWPDLPLSHYGSPFTMAHVLQHLLYLTRRHNASLGVSWVKGHSGDYGNSRADEYALLGSSSQHFPFDVLALTTPPGWVDTSPVLNGQSLAHLTYSIVRHKTPSPLFGRKFTPFCVSWTLWIHEHFHTYLDISRHFKNIWTINIPVGMRGFLWKVASRSLPIGSRSHGAPGFSNCHCGAELTVGHMWGSCPSYNLRPLLDLLCQKIDLLCTTYGRTLNPYEWKSPYWYHLIALKPLETLPDISRKRRQSFGDSRSAREWAIGSFFWYIWRMRAKEVMEGRTFMPIHHVRFMKDVLELPTPSEPVTPPTRPTVALPITPLPHSPKLLAPRPTCRDANFFRIWCTLLRTPTPPYAPMPPTPPASPSPLLMPADMVDLDIATLPALPPPRQILRPPSPVEVTDNTYQVVYDKQLPDSTLDILALLIADEETPPTPEILLLPITHTSLYQGYMVPPLTPVLHIPALSLLEPDPPPILPAPEPPDPPDPPTHSSGCDCTPCMIALDELYN